MKKAVITTLAPTPIGPYSQAVVFGNMIFVSGQIAIEPSTGILIQDNVEIETKKVMENIGNVLKEAGFDYSNIVKSGIFLKNMNDFPKVNEVYASFLTAPFPARETVEVARLPKDANVEISVIACK